MIGLDESATVARELVEEVEPYIGTSLYLGAGGEADLEIRAWAAPVHEPGKTSGQGNRQLEGEPRNAWTERIPGWLNQFCCRQHNQVQKARQQRHPQLKPTKKLRPSKHSSGQRHELPA